MKRGLLLCLFMLLVLAACGGNEGPTEEVRPTLEPTLPFEERIQFSAGRAENPLQMVIRPVDVVEKRVYLILATQLQVPLTRLAPDTLLRNDLGLSAQLAELNDAMVGDFNFLIDRWDSEDILTVDDLVHYAQQQIGEQISQALFFRTGLYIDVILVDSYGEGLRLLCDSGSGIVSVPWLDGISYTAAVARNCGEQGVQVAIADRRAPEFEPLILPEFTPEPTPEMTLEATLEVTAEATQEMTPEVTEAPGEAVAPTDTPVPTDTPTAVPTEEPVSEATPEATMEATPEASDQGLAATLSTAEAGVIVVNANLGADVRSLQGRVFCRLNESDVYSWFVPLLVLAQNNIDLEYSALQIVDYPDEMSLLQAVADGDCAGTGVSQSTWDALGDMPGLVAAETTIEFPHGVLVYPLEVGLGVRLTLNEQLALMAEDPFDGRPLRLLLGQDAIVPIQEGDFAILSAFMQLTGYDFAQLGD